MNVGTSSIHQKNIKEMCEESGERRMENGKWKMESGDYRRWFLLREL
jgi:hypothetical protein